MKWIVAISVLNLGESHQLMYRRGMHLDNIPVWELSVVGKGMCISFMACSVQIYHCVSDCFASFASS